MVTVPQRATGGTILVVDDEDEIIQFMQDVLEDEGYCVYATRDGKQALQLARSYTPDLIILDVMMPGCDGFTVCRQLREEWDIPILFLSAKQSDVDKLQGFRAGADDYVMKPFSIQELIARIEAHLRRQRRDQQKVLATKLLHHGQLVLDLSSHEVCYAGTSLPLTRKEFELLQLLILHPHQVFSRNLLYEHIWGLDALSNTDTVTEHIKRLRRKLAQLDPHTEYISTVWGVGYKMLSKPTSKKYKA